MASTLPSSITGRGVRPAAANQWSISRRVLAAGSKSTSGAGVLSPWVFGLALDWGQGRFGVGSTQGWVAAWSSVGLGALLGPWMIARFARLQRAC